jgi:hypothetical protein
MSQSGILADLYSVTCSDEHNKHDVGLLFIEIDP